MHMDTSGALDSRRISHGGSSLLPNREPQTNTNRVAFHIHKQGSCAA